MPKQPKKQPSDDEDDTHSEEDPPSNDESENEGLESEHDASDVDEEEVDDVSDDEDDESEPEEVRNPDYKPGEHVHGVVTARGDVFRYGRGNHAAAPETDPREEPRACQVEITRSQGRGAQRRGETQSGMALVEPLWHHVHPLQVRRKEKRVRLTKEHRGMDQWDVVAEKALKKIATKGGMQFG